MAQHTILKPYKASMDVSYAPGAYTARELLLARPDTVDALYATDRWEDRRALWALCLSRGVSIRRGDRALSLINRRENTYVLAVFRKYACRLVPNRPHITLVRPNDEGNLGAMLRTALACGIRDVALVDPAADPFHPRTLRASRGAAFWLELETYASFEAYRAAHPDHALFPFMLEGGLCLDAASCPRTSRFTLIFGNESTGLPPAFQTVGQALTIPQTAQVDSLNVAVAMGIGTHIFARRNGLL